MARAESTALPILFTSMPEWLRKRSSSIAIIASSIYVPEAFKVLVKELQSLCLDVRVLDEKGEEIELKNDDDEDDFRFRDVEDYRSDDDEIISSGYSIEDVDEPDGGTVEFDDYDDDYTSDAEEPDFDGPDAADEEGE